MVKNLVLWFSIYSVLWIRSTDPARLCSVQTSIFNAFSSPISNCLQNVGKLEIRAAKNGIRSVKKVANTTHSLEEFTFVKSNFSRTKIKFVV